MTHPCPIIEGMILLTHLHVWSHLKRCKTKICKCDAYECLYKKWCFKKYLNFMQLSLHIKVAHFDWRWKNKYVDPFIRAHDRIRKWEKRCYPRRKTRESSAVQADVRAEIKMFHIERSEMNWARLEEKKKNQWISGWGERDGITNGICQWGTAAAK